MQAAGFVLTGGNSTRMGRDKALLPCDGDHLVNRVAAKLGTVASSVTLIGRPQRYRYLPWPCLDDIRPGHGPLGGLETLLSNTATEWNLVVACDMPDLQVDWLQALLRYATSAEAPCVITRDLAGKVHPLCGAYHVRCLGVVRRALGQERLKLTSVVHELGAAYLQSDAGLNNLNTPLDWAEWRQSQS